MKIEDLWYRSRSAGACAACRSIYSIVIKILDAFGKDYIPVETVGVGQHEVEIVKTVQLTVLICAPGHGDAIQALKCGIMEIADIIVVNKSEWQK